MRRIVENQMEKNIQHDMGIGLCRYYSHLTVGPK